MGSAVTIEPLKEALRGPCDCCGQEARTVWGLASMDGRPVAAYYVRWTPGQVGHGADFDLVLGKWGDQAGAADRCTVALSYRLLESGPAFMVVDAAGRKVSNGGLAARALARSDVVGTPLAEQVFAIADAVLAADRRTAEILGGWTVRQE